MKNASQVADEIIAKFAKQGTAKGKRIYFGYVRQVSHGVIVSRERGQDYMVHKDYIIKAVEAVRKEPSIYEAGPTRLHPYIDRWIYSPLWALLRLMTLEELLY